MIPPFWWLLASLTPQPSFVIQVSGENKWSSKHWAHFWWWLKQLLRWFTSKTKYSDSLPFVTWWDDHQPGTVVQLGTWLQPDHGCTLYLYLLPRSAGICGRWTFPCGSLMILLNAWVTDPFQKIAYDHRKKEKGTARLPVAQLSKPLDLWPQEILAEGRMGNNEAIWVTKQLKKTYRNHTKIDRVVFLEAFKRVTLSVTRMWKNRLVASAAENVAVLD